MKKILSIILAGLAFFGINKATAEEINMTGKKVLVVYFSRTGEQYTCGTNLYDERYDRTNETI